jgi:hypothetical protein
MLVLGNGEHLRFGQATESDAIFKRDHLRLVPPQARTAASCRLERVL